MAPQDKKTLLETKPACLCLNHPVPQLQRILRSIHANVTGRAQNDHGALTKPSRRPRPRNRGPTSPYACFK